MRRRRRSDDTSSTRASGGASNNPRQKARGLIELASDERTPEEERASAALKAVALIRKYDLLETERAAKKTIFDVISDPKVAAAVQDVVEGARAVTDNAEKIANHFRRRR